MYRIARLTEKNLKAQRNSAANFKTVVRNVTSALVQNKKWKRSTTFAIAEIALYASICALPTSDVNSKQIS